MPVAAACTVCEHPDRVAVEAALRSGVPSLRTTADRYKLSKTAILRHRDKHMSGVVRTTTDVVRDRVRDAAPAQIERAGVLLAQAQAERAVEDALETRALAREILDVALGEPDENGRRRPPDVDVATRALKALVDANGGGVQRAIELVAKIRGEIKTGSQTLVLVQEGRVVHPELERVMNAVMAALVPFPEAGAAVVKALEEMGQGAGGI